MQNRTAAPSIILHAYFYVLDYKAATGLSSVLQEFTLIQIINVSPNPRL